MRPIDADLIPWDSQGCGHPNCKQACENVDGQPCGMLITTYKDVAEIPELDFSKLDLSEFGLQQIVHSGWVYAKERVTLSNGSIKEFDSYYCLECDGQSDKKSKWCPNCGAIMDV